MDELLTTIKSKADLGLIAHLLRRAGFGATPEEMDRFSKMDYDEIVGQLIDFSGDDYIPQDIISRFHKDCLLYTSPSPRD